MFNDVTQYDVPRLQKQTVDAVGTLNVSARSQDEEILKQTISTSEMEDLQPVTMETIFTNPSELQVL